MRRPSRAEPAPKTRPWWPRRTCAGPPDRLTTRTVPSSNRRHELSPVRAEGDAHRNVPGTRRTARHLTRATSVTLTAPSSAAIATDLPSGLNVAAKTCDAAVPERRERRRSREVPEANAPVGSGADGAPIVGTERCAVRPALVGRQDRKRSNGERRLAQHRCSLVGVSYVERPHGQRQAERGIGAERVGRAGGDAARDGDVALVVWLPDPGGSPRRPRH